MEVLFSRAHFFKNTLDSCSMFGLGAMRSTGYGQLCLAETELLICPIQHTRQRLYGFK